MRATILDTNAYRELNDSLFGDLLSREASRGVYPVLDSWALMELLAGVAEPLSREYRAYVRAVGRLASRSLNGGGHLVLPLQAQARKLLLNEDPAEYRTNAQFLADTALWVANSSRPEDEPELIARCSEVAARVQEQEREFAESLRELGNVWAESVRKLGGTMGRDLRQLLRSDDYLRETAAVVVSATFSQAGRAVPDPIPSAVVDEVVRVFRAGLISTAVTLEKVFCDGAQLASESVRNLVWDQSIAANVGHHLGDLPVLVVTRDRYFAEAAHRAGFPASVTDTDSYVRMLESEGAA